MAITSRKITTYVDNMKDVPVIPNIPGTALLAKMDSRTDNEVKTSINGIVDDLIATTDGASGADQIGATAIKSGGATKVQGQLEEIYADTAHLTGDQTIAGVKTFSSSPVVPTPSTDYQASTKKYVDDVGNTKLTADNITQTITGASRTDKVISEAAYNSKQIEIGASDMLQSTYDTQGKHTDAFNSANHSYDNTDSGITATNVKDAIDETYELVNTNNAILVRDILHIKMRQTGLNLDPNAWSDTLEDINGINTSVSSGYIFDATNKSLKKGENTLLSYTTINTLSYWNLSSSPYTKFSQGFKATSTTPIKGVIFKTYSSQSSYGSAVINIRIETNNAGNPSGTLASAGSYVNNISVPSTANTEVSATLTTPFTPVIGTQYHIVFVWVSGTTTFTADTAGTYADGAFNYYSTAWQNPANNDIYFKLTSEAESALIYWKSTTSDGTLTKAVVESVQTLGTGTITYYISRDGGATFTQCTLGTITSISTQPISTSIVLKAVITGNSELFAVAWGGQV